MNLQFKIFKNVLIKLKKIHLIVWGTLLLYYVIFIYLNKYDTEYYTYIFGIINFKNSFALLLLLLNISYLTIILYCFFTYEITHMPYEIILRTKSQNWLIKKISISLIFTITLKILQYIIFIIINYYTKIFIDINFIFYFKNILLYINITIILLCYFSNKKKLIAIIYLTTNTIMLFSFHNISFIMTIIYIPFLINNFNIKDCLKL